MSTWHRPWYFQNIIVFTNVKRLGCILNYVLKYNHSFCGKCYTNANFIQNTEKKKYQLSVKCVYY